MRGKDKFMECVGFVTEGACWWNVLCGLRM